MRKIIKGFLLLTAGYTIGFLIIITIANVFDLRLLLILAGLEIISIIFSIFIITSSKRLESKLAWIIIILFLPAFGLFTYWFFGRKYRPNKKWEAYYSSWKNIIMADIKKLLNNHDLNQIKINDQSQILTREFPEIQSINAQFLTSGGQFFTKLINDLETATQYIFLNFYIMSEGEILNKISEILLTKAQTGVKIFIIADHAGSIYLISKDTRKTWAEAGIRFVMNATLGWSFWKGKSLYRNHRKDVVIDGRVAYTGGINLSDTWLGTSSSNGLINDLQVRLTGPSIGAIKCLFLHDWLYATKNVQETEILFKLIRKNLPAILHADQQQSQNNPGTIISQNPGEKYSQHMNVMINAIAKAKKKILISTPYFIPPPEIIRALIIAANNGVQIKLLVPGLTDFILDITRMYCDQVFTVGVEIYELNNTLNHAKIMVIDDTTILMGTTNIDFRSFFTDRQTLVIVESTRLVKSINKWWNWNWNHATKWESSILQYKNRFYIFFLKIVCLMAPIL